LRFHELNIAKFVVEQAQHQAQLPKFALDAAALEKFKTCAKLGLLCMFKYLPVPPVKAKVKLSKPLATIAADHD